MWKRYIAGGLLFAAGLITPVWATSMNFNFDNPQDFMSITRWQAFATTSHWPLITLGGLMILIQFWHDCTGSSVKNDTA